MRIINLKLRTIFLLTGLFVYLFIGSIPARAGALSLTLDPSIITIKAIPPATTNNIITIQNKSENQVILKIQLNPFKPKLENGELEYLDSQDYSQIFSNIKILDGDIPIDSLTLESKQQKKLTLNVTIPQDTNISDYYFSIIFISQNSSSAEDNFSLNQAGIATNVLLSVGSLETPKAILEEFSSDLFFENGPVPFTLRVKNQGTHFIQPKGEIIIKNMFGQSIGKLDLTRVNILSNSTRAIPNDLNIDFKSPKILWKENFLLGFYSATLNLPLSDEGPTFTKSIHFFAFPFQLLIIIIALLIGGIFLTKKIKKYMNKNRT